MVHLYLRRRKALLKRFILTAILFILAFFIYSFLRFITLQWFHLEFLENNISVLIISVVLISVAYKPLDYLVVFLFKDVLFTSNGRDQSAFLQLARSMTAVLDRNELANLIVNTLGDMLHVRTVSVFLFDKSKSVYRMISSYGLKTNVVRHVSLSSNSLLIELLRVRKIPLERQKVVHSFSWQEANRLTQDLELLHASCVIPLIDQDELIGLISMTPQSGARYFTSQEMKSFSEFANEAAKAFRNAALFYELKESNQELMKIQSHLIHSAQHSAIAQLATGLAHEIHNPLTIISGKAQILLLKRDKIVFDDQVSEVLKTIVKQTKRAADITRKLLMFSESHKSIKEPVDLEMVVNDTIALLSYQVSLDQIQVLKRLEHPIPKLTGNKAELREAFLNIFLNAVQAIGTKGNIEVRLRIRQEQHAIELSVRDSGCGISSENLPKIFQPFYTSRQGSSGLGLFVTQQIIHGYGGSIRVESMVDQGTAFIIHLPCGVTDEEKRGHELKTNQPAGITVPI